MKNKYLTVKALTNYIKRKIDTDPHLTNIFIKGEISNFNHHRRGHMYFTLKDDHARISALMFAGYNRKLAFTPENGMSVFIKGEVSVYESFGQYQLYVHEMSPDGIGALYLAFEQLKEKLNKEGLFDDRHKRSLPKYPKRIGVVTSDTGAAIQDILTTFKKRYPVADITLFPASVQGELAANSIVDAIKKANQFETEIDVLIVGRGGGSIEDLQAFNDERVARAIFSSKIPVISAIGHETDITISDFVSDLRAPTPTGAVMLCVPSTEELINRITHYKQVLLNQTKTLIQTKKKQLDQNMKSYAFRYPEQLIKQKEQELDLQIEALERNSKQLLEKKIQEQKHLFTRLKTQNPEDSMITLSKNFDKLQSQLKTVMKTVIMAYQRELNTSIDKLNLLSPLHTIQRGFALPFKKDGTLIKNHKQVKKDDQITVEIQDAYINCTIKDVEEKHDKKSI